MSVNLIALLIAALAGASMAVQGSLNSALSKIAGLAGTTLIVHIVGLALIVLLLLFGLLEGQTENYLQAPWYTYLGGTIGVLIIYTVAYSITNVGVAKATTAIVVAQVSTALLVDHFGLFGLREVSFTWMKGMGVVLLAGGVYMMLAD